MLATHPVGYLRFLISIAALGLLAALLLLPAPVRAQARDTTAPTLLVANVDGTSLKLIYSEAMDTGSVPEASDFGVSIQSGTAAAPSSVNVVGAKVELTLSTGPASGNTVTLAYTKGTNPVQDLAGNDAADLSTHAVANYTDTTNHLPVFPTAAVTRSVAETNTSGTVVGTAVTATDADIRSGWAGRVVFHYRDDERPDKDQRCPGLRDQPDQLQRRSDRDRQQGTRRNH